MILPFWENIGVGRFCVKINHWGRARKFIRAYPNSGPALKAWKHAVAAANWSSFPEVRRTFNSVDWFEGALVFNIGGNNVRLVAVCRFELKRLYIDKVMTHEEYDADAWKARYRSTRH
jgi:mRNA interferase HigB